MVGVFGAAAASADQHLLLCQLTAVVVVEETGIWMFLDSAAGGKWMHSMIGSSRSINEAGRKEAWTPSTLGKRDRSNGAEAGRGLEGFEMDLIQIFDGPDRERPCLCCGPVSPGRAGQSKVASGHGMAWQAGSTAIHVPGCFFGLCMLLTASPAARVAAAWALALCQLWAVRESVEWSRTKSVQRLPLLCYARSLGLPFCNTPLKPAIVVLLAQPFFCLPYNIWLLRRPSSFLPPSSTRHAALDSAFSSLFGLIASWAAAGRAAVINPGPGRDREPLHCPVEPRKERPRSTVVVFAAGLASRS